LDTRNEATDRLERKGFENIDSTGSQVAFTPNNKTLEEFKISVRQVQYQMLNGHREPTSNQQCSKKYQSELKATFKNPDGDLNHFGRVMICCVKELSDPGLGLCGIDDVADLALYGI